MGAYAQQQKTEHIDEEARRQFETELEACMVSSILKPERNRLKEFLREANIFHMDQMDYKLRCDYRRYLIYIKKIQNAERYLLAYDRIKQVQIQRQYPVKQRWKLKKQIFYLPYHPDKKIAEQMMNLRSESALVWDFSRPCSELLRKQIFTVLNEILKSGTKKGQIKEKLSGLQALYEYAANERIKDLEEIDQQQTKEFFLQMDNLYSKQMAGKKKKILDYSLRTLFRLSEEIHWNANIWYIESLKLAEHRINPSASAVRISFLEIADAEWRCLAKEYMKYQIGIGGCAVSTMKLKYTDIRNLLVWLGDEKIGLSECSKEVMHDYFRKQEKKKVAEKRYNDIILAIHGFFMLLVVHGKLKRVPFEKDYYLKKEIKVHHDRSLTTEQYQNDISLLPYMEETMRCMYLHFWCMGLRISEVCTLKGNAYYRKNGDTWIKLYQQKAKTYKRIPIPEALYKIMQVYKRRHQVGPDDYVFQSKDGGAYKAATCSRKLKEFFEEYLPEDSTYQFQSHAFRHTVATQYYDGGVSIQTLREYLGHHYLEMTQQYIDYMPQKIAQKNEEYFSKEGHSLAGCLRKEMSQDEVILHRTVGGGGGSGRSERGR